MSVRVTGRPVPFVGEAVPLLGSDLSPVKRRPELGQVGLRVLEGLLGGLGADLGLPHPDIVQGQGGQPFTLGVLDDLPGQLGQLARTRPSPSSQLLERHLGSVPWVAASTPLACSIQTRLVNAWRSWATSSLWLASSTLVWTSSPATAANSRAASSSWAVQARGRVL